MSARITAGMLCYLVGLSGDAWEWNGRVVTTVQFVRNADVGWTDGQRVFEDVWHCTAQWLPPADSVYGWAFAAYELRPIAGPGIDTTETTDALHDSLVAVLAEARPV